MLSLPPVSAWIRRVSSLGLAFFSLALADLPSAVRAATPAGTEILNQATATFEWLGRSHTVTSNLVSNSVLPVHGLDIKPDGTVASPGLAANAAPGATVYLPYTLLNTGNVTDSFRLSLVFLSDSSTFEPLDRRVFIDLDGDGLLSPQEAAASVDRVNQVPAGGLVHLLVQIRIPAGTPNGARAYFDLRGRSLADATATDEDNVARITLSEEPVLRLRKSSDRPSVQGGGTVTYTLDILHVSGASARGDLPVVDGAPRRGVLLADAIPEFITGGTRYVAGSLAVEFSGAERIYSTDDGLTWRSFSALGGEPAAAAVTHVGVLFPDQFAAGQSARARFQILIAPDHAPGRIGNRADLRYRASDDSPLTDSATNEVFVEVLPTIDGVFIGPAGDPRRFGEFSTNDDSTLDGGVNIDANGPYQLVGNYVYFRNTIENASRVPDVVNLDLVADDSVIADPAAARAFRAAAAAVRHQTTLPDGWIVQILSADGSRTLLDTNGDGIPDVGWLPAGGRMDVVVRVLIPAGYIPPPSQPSFWQFLVRAASASEPSRANLTINRIPRVLLADEFWHTFSKSFDAPTVILPGTSITYTNRFGHGGASAVTNVLIIDNLSERLVNARAFSSGSITSLDGSFTITGVTADYDPVANRIVWRIPVVPPGFVGEIRFTADVAPDTPGGTEIPNEFTITSDQSAAVRVSNTVSTVVNAPAVLTVEKEVNRENASVGDPVLYTVTVSNAGPVALISGVSLVDDLPRGFRYLPGSARIDGARLEPVIDPSGTSLAWPLGDLALGDTRTITYVTIPSIDALQGDGRNVATATGTFPGGGSGTASDVAVVRLDGGPFENRSVVLGRVFVDENGDGAFTPGERGLQGVRLVLDDGVTVLTDRDGFYHIEGVTPGIRAFRLDESTLPPGHVPAILDSQNALNPSSRFLDLRFGVLHRANFAVLPPAGEIVRIQKTAPTAAVLLDPVFLSQDGATHATLRWTGETAPIHRIDLNTGTVSLFFPGVVKTGSKTDQPVDELNVDRFRIHTDRALGYTRLDLRLRKRTSGYPADYVAVSPATTGPDGGELRVSVGGAQVGDNDAAARTSAAVESALRSVGRPEPAAELAEQHGPVIHEPADGASFISRDKITVRVSAHLASGFELYVNGQPVPKEQIGEKSIHIKARRSFYEYVSVPIAPGPNKLRFETTGPSPEETGAVELTVFRAAEPKKIELVVTDDQLVADGRSEPVVGIVLRDENGFPTGEATVVTVEISAGQILSPDFRPMEPGHQVQIRDGQAQLRLSPANQAETRTLTVSAGRLQLRSDLVLRPALRDWILVGSASATASLTESREAATRTRALREDTRETIDSALRVFGQGRFVADSLLTFAYDSERKYEDYPIFRQFQDDDYYPVYGDTSKIFPEAASRAKLYARLEKDQSYVMFGDIDTEMQETELAAHSRRLTGAKADIKTDWFDFKGFISNTEQARVRVDIPGGGVSYYQLQDRDIIPGSDEIWLEVRNRNRPAEVVSREQLSRGRDYNFDYSFGRILFKRPISSRDPDFNPQVIVVNYEKDGRTGEKQYTFGGRPALHDPDRRVTVGATYLEEQNGFFSDKVEGVDATVKLDDKTTVRGEYAETRTFDEGFGRGHLVELKREEEKTSYRLYHSDLDPTFDNPGLRGSPVGRRVTGAEATHYFTPRVSGELEAYDQIDATGDRTLQVGLADFLYEGDNYKLGLGGGYVRQEEDDPTLGAQERESPLLRLRAGYAFNSRFDVEGEYQHAFGDNDTEQPTRGAVTFGYQLFENTRLMLGLERRYVTNEGMADNLLFGTEVTVNDHVSVFNKYELDAGQSGQAGRANTGVAFKYPLRPDLRVDLTAEANNTIHETGRAPVAREFWSVAAGFEYTPSAADHTLVGRHEYKWQPDRREHFNELGGTVKLFDDHTAFARNRISYAQVSDPDEYEEWIARVLLGWAYRPLFQDRLNFISSLEFNYERTASANLAKIQDVLSSHEFTFQTSPDWIIEGKYAVKAAWGDFVDDIVWTDVKALRIRYDFTRRFYGAAGARLYSQYNTDVHTLGYGVEAGCVVRKDFIIALGWNFEGFSDRRFSAGDHWEEGAYVAFRVKFDESLFGIVNKLRGRSRSDAGDSATSYAIQAAPTAP